MNRLSFLTHFAAAVIVTGIFLTIYATVQQAHRSGANDPQLQLARDILYKVSNNKLISPSLPDDTVEISQSLGTFITLYNNSGIPVASTGLLDGKPPRLPGGVFEFTRNNQEEVFTWQPRAGVRIATVLEATPTGFIAVGRSLTEVEVRESNLVKMVIIAWIACLATIVAHLLIQLWVTKKSNPQ